MFEAIGDAIVSEPTKNNVPTSSLIGGVRYLERHHLAIA
jgi:hypothetical protein